MRIILFLNLLGAVFTLLLSSSAVSSSSSNSTNVSSIVNQENAQYMAKINKSTNPNKEISLKQKERKTVGDDLDSIVNDLTKDGKKVKVISSANAP
jgi:hypothetical protein